MVIADDVTGRDFVTNIIVATCNLGDVHPEVREDLYRHCDELLNYTRDATKLASCQGIAIARFGTWLSRRIDSMEDSKARMALWAAHQKYIEIVQDGGMSGTAEGWKLSNERWHWYQETPYGMRSACLRFFVGLGSSKSDELVEHPPDDELICEQCFEPYIRSTR